MCISLALISGKGGSGKTTIGLSISEILASCGKKILYIDCDMSTHGATYFFEPFITDKKNLLTTSELFSKYNDKNNNHNLVETENRVLSVAENIDFIPSCIDFSKPFFEDKRLSFSKKDYYILKEEYDLIIFDCQAGYSLVTDRVLDITDYNLIVMEEDAISSSSVRVLHTQLSNQLDNSKTYQVFNKLSDEDYEVYKKITNGTMFTNLTPVMFDWSVKRAFIAHDLPEINENNPVLTENIFKLTCEIFPMFKTDLEEYIIGVKEKLIFGIQRNLEENKRKRKYSMISKMIPILTIVMCLIVLIIEGFSLMNSSIENNEYSIVVLVAVTGVVIAFLEAFYNRRSKREIQENQEKADLKIQLEKLENDVTNLSKKYKYKEAKIGVDEKTGRHIK